MATQPRLIGLYSPAPQSGKSTVAGLLESRHQFSTRSFATPLKRMVVDLLNSLGMNPEEIGYHMHEGKEAPIDKLGGASFRYLTQTLGTDWGRKLIDNDMWARAATEGDLSGLVVWDDVRFINEAEAIRAKGGVIWRVERPGATSQTSHVSEGQLEGYAFDAVLTNNGTMEELEVQVASALRN